MSDGRVSRLFPSAPANRRIGGFTDIHCHCLPGLDDGPADMGQALALCRALVEDGVTQVVASPHQLGRFDGRYEGPAVRQAVQELNRTLRESSIPLTVLPGADVRLDERIPQLVASGAVLTVADGRRYLLLELPHEIFIEPQVLLAQLNEAGLTAVITHPERQSFLAGHPEHVDRWRDYRPCLQITAASLTGDFGRRCEAAAWTFLQSDLPLVVATDAHDTGGRAPRLRAAYQRLQRRLGAAAGRLLCVENPQRLVTGRELAVLGQTLPQKEP